MTTSDKDEKISSLHHNEHKHRKLDCLNYCVSGLMSRCSAGTVWDEQKKCKFSEKSTVSNRCMYYIEAIDGHCDCVEAQRELRMKERTEKDDL
ncbi:MAG: hypothetical protein JSV31_18765 [Desulfobacterales bacterium]|jgi:hypothetical protein|nr:MAG: hypothetical protein JSV31_18765 [Desulfobacterales bacterium]